MVMEISERMLANKANVKVARMRKWRREFLHEQLDYKGLTDPMDRGKPANFSRRDAFRILLTAEVLKHGGSRIDALDKIQQVELVGGVDTQKRFLWRVVTRFGRDSQFTLGDWQINDDPPEINPEETVSVMLICLQAIRAEVDKMLK